MNRLRHHEQGIGHLAMVLVVLVFSAIGAIGYTLYANPQQPAITSGTDQSEQPIQENELSAPAIDEAGDLDKAINVLDQVDPAGSSASDKVQLNNETDQF